RVPGSELGWSALAAGRGGEFEHCREHDLLAVQGEAVCPREQNGDLLPQGRPLIKVGAPQQAPHGRALSCYDFDRRLTFCRPAHHSRQPPAEKISYRAEIAGSISLCQSLAEFMNRVDVQVRQRGEQFDKLSVERGPAGFG